jgi:hypothetical protein
VNFDGRRRDSRGIRPGIRRALRLARADHHRRTRTVPGPLFAFIVTEQRGSGTVSWFKVGCMLMGHDDVTRRTSDRLFLECAKCGRSTPGWEVTTGGAVAPEPLHTVTRAPETLRVLAVR